jgi:hypothetical protein
MGLWNKHLLSSMGGFFGFQRIELSSEFKDLIVMSLAFFSEFLDEIF